MVSYETTILWGHTVGKETPQRMLNQGLVLPNLLMGGGSKGNNGTVKSHATTHRSGQTGDIYEYPSSS
jgi:hypothetical protein